MTDDLARAGWAQFQAIEAEGGLAASLTSGALAERVAASREILAVAVRNGSIPLLGVSLYPAEDNPVSIEPRPVRTVADPPDPRQAGSDDMAASFSPIRLSDFAKADA